MQLANAYTGTQTDTKHRDKHIDKERGIEISDLSGLASLCQGFCQFLSVITGFFHYPGKNTAHKLPIMILNKDFDVREINIQLIV